MVNWCSGGSGAVNQAGIDFYNKLIDAIIAKGSPRCTLVGDLFLLKLLSMRNNKCELPLTNRRNVSMEQRKLF